METAKTPETESTGTPDQRQHLIQSMEKLALVLPPMPGIVLRLQQELGNEWVNIQRLSNLVRSDPTLAGSVLRVANSPYWRGSRQIVEIEEAIQRMGMETLRSITTVMAIRSSKISEGGPMGSTLKDFWRHSLLVAVGSVQIARRSPVDRQGLEQVWMAGLLHDIGVLLAPVLYSKPWAGLLTDLAAANAAATPDSTVDSSSQETVPDVSDETLRIDLLQLERAKLGIDHGRIGGVFVERHWKLPDPIVVLVENWSEPSRVTPPLLAWAVNRADQAAQALGLCWQPESTRVRELEELDPESGAMAACDPAVCMECVEKSVALVDALLSEG